MASHSRTLAFDVYGTLVNTHGVVTALEKLIGDKASEFSMTWRDKQLEYSFRRALMQKYENFAVCICDALDYTCSFYQVEISIKEKNELLEIYFSLPPFNDVEDGLKKLKGNNRLFAFSNATSDMVNALLTKANIRHYFEGVVRVDDVKTFKPNPLAYTHFLQISEADIKSTWLISSNSFDVIGAASSGMHTAWVQRSDSTILDPWGVEPEITVKNLIELNEKIG
ncbi:MAG: haloacid dehalogenase type II [Bacteroidota bacterium]